jgi:hypothetical protein
LANTYFESAPHKAHIVVALFVALFVALLAIAAPSH